MSNTKHNPLALKNCVLIKFQKYNLQKIEYLKNNIPNNLLIDLLEFQLKNFNYNYLYFENILPRQCYIEFLIQHLHNKYNCQKFKKFILTNCLNLLTTIFYKRPNLSVTESFVVRLFSYDFYVKNCILKNNQYIFVINGYKNNIKHVDFQKLCLLNYIGPENNPELCHYCYSNLNEHDQQNYDLLEYKFTTNKLKVFIQNSYYHNSKFYCNLCNVFPLFYFMQSWSKNNYSDNSDSSEEYIVE